MIKNYYEDQIDALMEQQIEKDNIITKLKGKNQQQQHLLEQRDRKIDEQKDLLESRNMMIEELNIAKEVLLNEAKEKEREYAKTYIQIEDVKLNLSRKEETVRKYLAEIQ